MDGESLLPREVGSVWPTLNLSRWMADRQGLPGKVAGDLQSAIRVLRATSTLHLPQNHLSVEKITELDQMIDIIREHNVPDFLPKIRGHVANHCDDTTT